MNDVVVTTTSNFECGSIKKYLGVVYSNIVIGTNIFSDISASLSDIFGGKSESYRRKLELIRNDAIKELKQKAYSLGANAIVSLHIDFDEISGGGKSMFMVSASGTACYVSINQEECIKDSTDIDIPITIIHEELIKDNILRKIYLGEDMNINDYELLLSNPCLESLMGLVSLYIKYDSDRNYHSQSIEYIEKIIDQMPYEESCNIIYDKITSNKCLFELIKFAKLFNPEKVLKIIKSDLRLGVKFLACDKKQYNVKDLSFMKEIQNVIDNLPDLGKIDTVKSGMFGKESPKYICPNGHKNDIDNEYCTTADCWMNIKGLNRQEVDVVNNFRNKVSILENLLTKS